MPWLKALFYYHLLICWYLVQERIRVGKELLEAKRMEEDNERKRYVFSGYNVRLSFILIFVFVY